MAKVDFSEEMKAVGVPVEESQTLYIHLQKCENGNVLHKQRKQSRYIGHVSY